MPTARKSASTAGTEAMAMAAAPSGPRLSAPDVMMPKSSTSNTTEA